MSQRFCLFYAGYTASAPSLYFNKVVLFDNYLSQNSENRKLSKLSEQVYDLKFESTSDLKTAISIADHFKLDVMPQPALPGDYFEWLKDYTAAFEEKFPLTRIEHYYFFYARKIAEMLSHVGMLHALAELAQCLNLQESVLRQMDTYLSETETLIFRNRAATALLSSEPRHSCFMALYNDINKEFEKFKAIDPLKLDAVSLKQFQKDLDDLKCKTLDGFKRCIGLLKELGI